MLFKIKQNPRKKNEWINEKHRRRKQCQKKNPQGNAQLLGDRDIHACNTNLVYIIYIYIFSFLHQKADPSNYLKVYTCTLKSVLSVYILTMNIPSLLCIVILSETVHVIQTPIVVSLQQLLTSSSLCARDSYKHYICGQFYIYSCNTSF